MRLGRRLRRRHGTRSTADCLKLSDGQTAMKNTDGVFVRRARRTGAKDADKPVNEYFWRIFAEFSHDRELHKLLSSLLTKIPKKRRKNTENKRKT